MTRYGDVQTSLPVIFNTLTRSSSRVCVHACVFSRVKACSGLEDAKDVPVLERVSPARWLLSFNKQGPSEEEQMKQSRKKAGIAKTFPASFRESLAENSTWIGVACSASQI